MYLEHWDMNILPFENTPNPSFFYPSSMHKEALERLTYTVSQGKGAAMMVGGIGCGKTIISHALIHRLRKDRYRVVAMTNPAFEPNEFIEMVMRLFQVPNGYDRSKAEMLHCLESHLKKNYYSEKVCQQALPSLTTLDSAVRWNCHQKRNCGTSANFEDGLESD